MISIFFQLFNKTIQAIPNEYRDQAIDNFAKEHGFDFSVEEFKHFTDMPENSDSKNYSPEARLSINKLERVFIWLSGVSPKILATCPESEQKKHAALAERFDSRPIGDCYRFVFALHLKL